MPIKGSPVVFCERTMKNFDHGWSSNKAVLSRRLLAFIILVACCLCIYNVSNTGKSSDRRFDEIARLYQQTRVDCSAIFSNDTENVKRALAIAQVLAAEEEKVHGHTNYEQVKLFYDSEAKSLVPEVMEWYGEFEPLTNQWYHNATIDCESFKRRRGYITSSLTQEEENFPIAFSLLVFKDIEMVDRVLRSVYRPQNLYCIHVDSKSDPEFYSAVQSVAACFPDNVRMSSRRVDVQWGHFSVLEPELICMEDLWDMDENVTDITEDTPGSMEKQRRKKWKYFINLTGQEFPLKTNYEIVQILKAYKGANNVEGTRIRAYHLHWAPPPPHGLIGTKGAVHTLLNRDTVDFILHHNTAKDLISWLHTIYFADETLWATINFNPQLNIPGTYNGTHLETKGVLMRYKQWYGRNCFSQQLQRQVCILSTGDLPALGESPKLYANKFFLHQDRIAIGCLEERLFNNTRDEYHGTKTFDTTFYEEQDFVINRIRGPAASTTDQGI